MKYWFIWESVKTIEKEPLITGGHYNEKILLLMLLNKNEYKITKIEMINEYGKN